MNIEHNATRRRALFTLIFALAVSGCAVGAAPVEPPPVVEDAGGEAAPDAAPEASWFTGFTGVWYPDAAPAEWSDDAGWVNPPAATVKP